MKPTTTLHFLFLLLVGALSQATAAPSDAELLENILTNKEHQQKEREKVENTKQFTIEDIKGWPVRTPSMEEFKVRDVFHDLVKEREEAERAAKLAAASALKNKDQTATEPVKPSFNSKEFQQSRVRTAVDTQAEAWLTLSGKIRLSSVLQNDQIAYAIFQLTETGEVRRIKEGDRLNLNLASAETQRAREAILRNYRNVETSSSDLPLETITLKLVKINSNALFFRIEEINGVSFFTDEQPVWAYEYTKGLF